MHNLKDNADFDHARWADDGGPSPSGREVYEEEMDRVFGERGLHSFTAKERPRQRTTIPASMVVLPKHYSRFEIEPVHFTVTNKLDLLESNVVKYMLRAPYKHGDKGKEDYQKVVRCAIMKAKQQLGDPDWWKPYKTNLAALLDEELSYGTA